MKKLFWDVETTTLDLLISTYQLKNNQKYFNHKDIVRDWSMLGAAWAFDDGKPIAISVSPQHPLDDKEVIKYLHGILSEADVLIGHNSDNFDIKKFNTRAISYGLPPLAPKVKIDTLKIARKHFKFTSNTLSYLCNFLGVSAKDDAPNWKKCIEGDAEELRNMREYNKNDVIATRDLYYKLMSWHDTHPNINNKVTDIKGKPVIVCNKCGSPELQRRGKHTLASGRQRQRYQCQSCGGWQQGKMI